MNEQAERQASFWSRFAAQIIDNVFIILPLAAIRVAVIGVIIIMLLGLTPDNLLAPAVFCIFTLISALLVHPVVSYLYYTRSHTKCGQTIGKRIMGIKVVRSDGSDIDNSIASVRWVGYFISCIFLGYGYLRVLWDPKRLADHDIMAGTKVIRIK